MPDWLTSVLFGIIEGITEFLPISSTGHLLIPQQLGWLEKQSDVFNIAIQSGAVIAVLFNFTERVKQLLFIQMVIHIYYQIVLQSLKEENLIFILEQLFILLERLEDLKV